MSQFPVVTLLTIVRASGEWAAVEIKMRGDQVVSREVLEQSRDHRHAWQAFCDAADAKFRKAKEAS